MTPRDEQLEEHLAEATSLLGQLARLERANQRVRPLLQQLEARIEAALALLSSPAPSEPTSPPPGPPPTEVSREATLGDLVRELNEKSRCPGCEKGRLVARRSRYGRFLGCSRYPGCRYTRPAE